MGAIRLIIVLILAGGIFGGAGWMAYRLYLEPRLALEAERKRAEREDAAAEAAPDPVEAEYAAVSGVAASASPDEARKMWAAFLSKHPDSPRAAAVRAVLGPLNMQALFTPGSAAVQATHTVARGDSLFRIARKHGTTVELLAHANKLGGTMLQVGQQLAVPKLQASLVIDRAAGVVRLQDRGAFLCEFPLLAAPPTAAPAEGRVADLVVEADGRRLAFGEKGYAAGTRSIVLSTGATLAGSPDGAPAAAQSAGFVVKESDLAGIFVLLSRGDPVTIR